MTKETRLAIDRSLMCAGERVCVAVSGGADSVALLLALAEANREKEALGVVLSAVHVHHGLRGAEADADEGFVLNLCEQLGVPLVMERVDVAARQESEREGMEEAARELRYQVFWELMKSGRVDAVATAHTLDDQAETVMMKLLRGAWTEGIGGVAPVIENKGQEGRGRIVRPMLGVRREDVEAYLRNRGQAWREDTTNGDVSLTRNRLRLELVPLLRGFNPGIDLALARLLPQVLLPGRPVRGGGRAVSTVTGNSSCAVEVERLRTMAPALRRRVMRAAARSIGCRISADETAKLLALAGLGQVYPPVAARSGVRLELAGGLRAERTAREIQLRVDAAPFVAKKDTRKAGREGTDEE
jgi:tRNA(Ile)-lysidine synthase